MMRSIAERFRFAFAVTLAVSAISAFARTDPATLRGLWTTDGGSLVRIEAEGNRHVGRLVQLSAEAEAAGYSVGEALINPIGPHDLANAYILTVLTRPQRAALEGLELTRVVRFTAESSADGNALFAAGPAGSFRTVAQDGRQLSEDYVAGLNGTPAFSLRRVADDALLADSAAPPSSWPRIQGIAVLNSALLNDPTVANPSVIEDPFELHSRDVTLLFVYGQSLVRQGTPVGTDSRIEYHTLIESANGALPAETTADPRHAARLAAAWRVAWDEAARQAGGPLRRADFHSLLVKAKIGRGVASGLQHLCIGSAVDAWPLERGQVRARAEFIRSVSLRDAHGFEQARPEPAATVYLQAQAADPIALQITLLEDPGEAVRELTAVIGLADHGEAAGKFSRSWIVTATRSNPNQPVFETRAIRASAAAFNPAEPASGARPGQWLVGIAGADGAVVSEVAIAQAALAEPLAHTGGSSDNDPAAALEGPSPLWRSALLEAAGVAGLRPSKPDALKPVDWEQLAKENAWERRGLIMPSGVTVRIGHHAAMLLLRQTFIAALEAELQRLDAAAAHERNLQELADFLRPLLRDPSHPLGQAIVETEYRGATQPPVRIPLARFFDPAFLAARAANTVAIPFDANAGAGAAARYHFELAQASNQLLRARLRTAIGIYQDEIRGAIDLARGAESAEDLLRLTGRGFEPVHDLVRPHLVRLHRERQGEVIVRGDDDARRYLGELTRLAGRLEFEDRRSREFIQFGTMFISLAALPVALAGGTGSLLIDGGLLAFNTADLAYGVYDYLSETSRQRQAVAFARGAAAVLGTDYLSRIQFQSTPGWAHAVTIVLTSLGIRGLRQDAFELLGHVPLGQAHRRAGELLSSYHPGSLESIKRWPAADQKLFLTAVSDAVARRTAAKLADLPNAAPLLRAADDVLSAAERLQLRREARTFQACSGTTLCFAPGTPVLTPSGPQSIETVAPGALVLSRTADGSESGFRRVRRVLTSAPAEFCVIDYVIGSTTNAIRAAQVMATPTHRFRTAGEEPWTTARDLTPAQRVLTAETEAEITSVHVVASAELGVERAYNLEIEEFSTYFAGDGALWVHNTGLSCEEGMALFANLLAQGHSIDGAAQIVRSRGLAAGAEARLNEALREIASFRAAQADIDAHRASIRADPFLGDSSGGGTVARILPTPQSARAIFGRNTTMTSLSEEFARAQRFLEEMQRRQGMFENLDLNHPDLQWLKHAEAQALMSAHERFGGRWARRVEMHVDRITCDLSCRRPHTGLIRLVELMGFEEVVIISRNGSRTVFRPGSPERVIISPTADSLLRFVTWP